MAEIQDILTRLDSVFSAIKLKYVIVGGIAVIHYGHLRTTQDVDIIIENDPSKIGQLIGLLRAQDFDIMEDQFRMAHREGTSASVFDEKSFFRLDIKAVNNKRELDVLNNAISKDVFGLQIKIAPLEYVLLGKLLYMGNIGDIADYELLEYQDVVDFLTIFHANKNKINFSLLENKITEYGLDDRYIRLKSLNIKGRQ